MTRVFTFVAVVLCCGISAALSQTNNDLQRVELLSPFVISESPHKVQWDKDRAKASCLDLHTLTQEHCLRTSTIGYGDRIGDHKDLFAIEISPDQQTRIVDLGRHDWSDKFDVPYIRPWAKLKPGESRSIAINASGTTAPDGKTYAKTSLANQVKSGVKKESDNAYEDNYTPLMEAIEGHMYAVRVLDSKNDYYILIRADKVVTGTSVTISFKKVPSPKGPTF